MSDRRRHYQVSSFRSFAVEYSQATDEVIMRLGEMAISLSRNRFQDFTSVLADAELELARHSEGPASEATVPGEPVPLRPWRDPEDAWIRAGFAR